MDHSGSVGESNNAVRPLSGQGRGGGRVVGGRGEGGGGRGRVGVR